MGDGAIGDAGSRDQLVGTLANKGSWRTGVWRPLAFGQECAMGRISRAAAVGLLELAASGLETDARLISVVLTRSALQQDGVSAVGFMFRGVH